MFKNCNAYAIASEQEWEGRLSGVLAQVGFRYSIRLEAAGRLESPNPNMLNFLIIHSSKTRDLVYSITRAVRANPDDTIRFMPIVVLMDASLESQVHEFINLGCDDIIIYPCPADKLAKRLAQQFKAQREYFQTSTYFGPDRRIATYDKPHPDRNDGKDSTYSHIIIKRELTGQINLVSKSEHQAGLQAAS